jgi:hypothetical protein
MRVVTREFWCSPADFACIAFGLLVRKRWPIWVALMIGAKVASLAGPSGAIVGTGVLLAALALPFFVWLRVCALAAAPVNRGFYTPRVMEIDADGVFMQPRGGEPISFRWSEADWVRRAHSGHLIRLRTGQHHFVPYYAFQSAEDRRRFSALVDAVNTLRESRRSADETATPR